MNEKTGESPIFTELSNALKQHVELELLINSTLDKSDFSNPAHLKALFEMQLSYTRYTVSMLKAVSNALEKLAEIVTSNPRMKTREPVDKLNEMWTEIKTNSESIKKIREILDSKV